MWKETDNQLYRKFVFNNFIDAFALQDVIEQLKHYGLSDSITPIGEITASEDFAVSVY